MDGYNLRLVRAAADWMDTQPEGSETLMKAMSQVCRSDELPDEILMEFLRDWLVSNPLMLMRMTPGGLADEFRNVIQTAQQFRGRPFPCGLAEAVEAFGPGIMPRRLPRESEEEERARQSLMTFLRKRKAL